MTNHLQGYAEQCTARVLSQATQELEALVVDEVNHSNGLEGLQGVSAHVGGLLVDSECLVKLFEQVFHLIQVPALVGLGQDDLCVVEQCFLLLEL